MTYNYGKDHFRAGFSTVTLKHDEGGKPFVRKRPKLEKFRDEDHMREAFYREVTVINDQRDSSHVPKILRTSKDENDLFFDMEAIPGKNLLEHFCSKRSTQFHLSDLPFYVKVGRAMEESHKRGFIHRDLNPRNILLNGGILLGRPTVVDWGNSNLDGLVSEGHTVGNPCFVSPEQAQGYENTDHRSDIYTLGADLYLATTGKLLFEAENPERVLTMQVFSTPIDIKFHNPKIPLDLCETIMKCIAKKPEDRYQSMEEFATALTVVHDDARGTEMYT